MSEADTCRPDLRRLETTGAEVRHTGFFTALCCPCVSAAQIASSVGLSFYLVLSFIALLYFTGVSIVTAALAVNAESFHLEFVFNAIAAKVALYAVGPYASLPLIAGVWFWNFIAGSKGEDDDIEVINSLVFVLLAFDVLCDLVFVGVASALRRRLQNRLHARPSTRLESCSDQCCIWIALSASISSVKQRQGCQTDSACDFGPLDEIPPYNNGQELRKHLV